MASLKRIMANGIDFAYLEDGEGPLVLLLHGFPDTAHTWDEIRPVLAAAGHRAVSPFMRGYHPTAIPEDGRYDTDTLGADALSLISALGQHNAIVVGHDWGVAAAYSAVALAPERVRLLVTVATPHAAAIRPSLTLAWRMRHVMRFKLLDSAEMMRRDDFAHVDELVRRWSPAWEVRPEHTAEVKEAFRHPGCVEAALGYYRALGFGPPKRLLEPVGVPSVAFAGTEDPFVRPEDYEHARSHFREHYEVVVMPGGHFLHREHPKRFVEELIRVLPKARRGLDMV